MYLLLATALACSAWSPPVPGPVVAGFAPSGLYSGHWGVDLEAAPGTAVLAPAAGTVTFAGTVARVAAVTITTPEGWKVTTSYLSVVYAPAGAKVSAGDLLGSSGLAHGRPAVHLSLRIDGRYVDPMGHCGGFGGRGRLRLLPPLSSAPR